MEIGIITFHRAHNYGAVLQCYALQEVLKGLGYDVCVIDYYQPATENAYKVMSWHALWYYKIHPRDLFRYLRKWPMRIERDKKFAEFRNKFFCLSPACFSNQDVPSMDCYVIGSDQLWNTRITNGYDSVFLGDFKRPANSRMVTYAVSGNMATLNAFTDEQLNKYTHLFDTLSLREKNMAESITQRTGLTTRVDLDPTLLTDRKLWEHMTTDEFKDKRYVLMYQIRRPIGDVNLLNRKAKQLAKQMNCKVIDLTDMTTYSPSQFVSLFKYAQCVITSSFHATVFALIFERPLYSVLLHDGHDGRYENLLHQLGAEKLLVETNFDPTPFEFDYTEVRKRLLELRKDSLQYLANLA